MLGWATFHSYFLLFWKCGGRAPPSYDSFRPGTRSVWGGLAIALGSVCTYVRTHVRKRRAPTVSQGGGFGFTIAFAGRDRVTIFFGHRSRNKQNNYHLNKFNFHPGSAEAKGPVRDNLAAFNVSKHLDTGWGINPNPSHPPLGKCPTPSSLSRPCTVWRAGWPRVEGRR